MRPRFREGEIVRVAVPVERFGPEESWLSGAEAVARTYLWANEAGDGWILHVALDPPEHVWAEEFAELGLSYEGSRTHLYAFEEDDLEPTGFQQDQQGRRRPLDPTPADERGDEITVVCRCRRRQGRDVSGDVAARLQALVSHAQLTVRRDPHDPRLGRVDDDHDAFEVAILVEPNNAGLAAFDAIVGTVDSGFYTCEDDGWKCQYYWHSEWADPDAIFLAAEVENAQIHLEPWSSPRRRPPDERRDKPTPWFDEWLDAQMREQNE